METKVQGDNGGEGVLGMDRGVVANLDPPQIVIRAKEMSLQCLKGVA